MLARSNYWLPTMFAFESMEHTYIPLGYLASIVMSRAVLAGLGGRLNFCFQGYVREKVRQRECVPSMELEWCWQLQ